MRSYIMTSGTVFGLILVAHVAKAMAEGPSTLNDPWFVGTSILAAALAVWAIRLIRASSTS